MNRCEFAYCWNTLSVLMRYCTTSFMGDLSLYLFPCTTRLAICNVIDGLGLLSFTNHYTASDAPDLHIILWSQLLYQQIQSPLLGFSLEENYMNKKDRFGFEDHETKHIADQLLAILANKSILNPDVFASVRRMIASLEKTVANRLNIRKFPLLVAAMDMDFASRFPEILLQKSITHTRTGMQQYDFRRLRRINSLGYPSPFEACLKFYAVPNFRMTERIVHLCDPGLVSAVVRHVQMRARNADTLDPSLYKLLKVQKVLIEHSVRSGLHKLGILNCGNFREKFRTFTKIAGIVNTSESLEEYCLWFWIQNC